MSYAGRVIGIRARDRSEINCRLAGIKGSPNSGAELISLIPEEKKVRLRNYNCVLVLDSGEKIVGPAIVEIPKKGKFCCETWILLGPISITGFGILTPERRWVAGASLSFQILEGQQNQFTLEAEIS